MTQASFIPHSDHGTDLCHDYSKASSHLWASQWLSVVGRGRESLESGLMECRLIAVGDPLPPTKENGERAMMRMNTSLWKSWSSFLGAKPDQRLHLRVDQIACPCRRWKCQNCSWTTLDGMTGPDSRIDSGWTHHGL